jgi:hypothetical protein
MAKPAKTKSGVSWVTWASAHAKDSDSIDDLDDGFKADVNDFIKALQDAGATVKVTNTLRSKERAYLFHWCWLIGLGKAKASEATEMTGVEIEWDHGKEEDSKKGRERNDHALWAGRTADKRKCSGIRQQAYRG